MCTTKTHHFKPYKNRDAKYREQTNSKPIAKELLPLDYKLQDKAKLVNKRTISHGSTSPAPSQDYCITPSRQR
jgi:hypothetical protein